MTVRRFPSELIGQWLAYMAGGGLEPDGLDLPRLVVQPANRPAVTEASGRTKLLPAGELQVLGFEARDLRVGERMVIARDRPGFTVARAPWRLFGPGTHIRVVVGGPEPERPDTVRLQTVGGYLHRYRHTPEHGTADASGAPCRLGTIGPLTTRPTIAHGVRRVGKEAHDVGEWLAEPTRPAQFGPTRADPRGAGERTFRDACRLIRRALDAGQVVRVEDGRGRRIAKAELQRAITSRTAPKALRQAIVAAAAGLTGRAGLDPASAVRLAVRTCVESACQRQIDGRSPRCPEHRATAARARSRRYRNRKAIA